MRIAIIGRGDRRGLGGELVEAARRMDLEVIYVDSSWPLLSYKIGRQIGDLTRLGFPGLDERHQGKIASLVAESECEIVISVDPGLGPEAVETLRKKGMKVAFWSPLSMSHIGRQLMVLAPYEVLFLGEPHLVERLSATLSAATFFLPDACSPGWFSPAGAGGNQPYLAYVGDLLPMCMRVLERLSENGIPMRICASGIPKWSPSGSLGATIDKRCKRSAELARVCHSAAGVIDLHPASDVDVVNHGLFQAAGAGAAVVTEFRPILPSLFAPGTEVLAFTRFDDIMFHARELLSDPARRDRLGAAAVGRVVKDHRYEHRITAILEKIT